MTRSIVLTCEHADRIVPAPYRTCFPDLAVLETHRGFDVGALALARTLGTAMGVEVIANPITRLLIEVNRSLHHRSVFSEFSRPLPSAMRERLVREVYEPHRKRVEDAVSSQLAAGRAVLHVGVHSFTPVLNGRTRAAEVGLLYDPKRAHERAVASAWKSALGQVAPRWRIRLNYPYRGAADGLTTMLRRIWSDAEYCGLELEVNSALLTGEQEVGVAQTVADSLAIVIRGNT